jgi:hypothetical protein
MSIPCMSVDYRDFINRDLPLVERGCTSKAAYVSRREARTWVRNGRRSHGSLDPYRCRSCGQWHLGHRRRGHTHAQHRPARRLSALDLRLLSI